MENPFAEKTYVVDFFRVAFFLLKKTIEIFKYMCLYFSSFSLIIVDYCSLLPDTILTEVSSLFVDEVFTDKLC